MASFRRQLEALLLEAKHRGIIDQPTESSLLALSAPEERAHGVGRLALVVSILGALGLTLGVILLFAANWAAIPDGVKLGGFVAIFALVHGGGLLLRWKSPDHPATAEALSFAGGGLFLCGLVLVTQLYHINTDPARGLAAWFLATLPLALVLRSTPLLLMATAAGLAWLHVKAFDWRESDVVAVLMGFEMCLAAMFIAVAPFAREFKASAAAAFKVVGGLGLGIALYLMGFFRYFANAAWLRDSIEEAANRHRLEAFFLMAAVLIVAGFLRGIVADRWTNRLFALLLLLTLWVAYANVGLLYGFVHPGEYIETFRFGYSERFQTMPLFTSVCAWVLWFGWGLLLIWEGTREPSNALVTLGVYGIALGLVTRYFDLMGTLASTGASFAIGGVILILCGWGAEKWRRKLKRMGGAGK